MASRPEGKMHVKEELRKMCSSRVVVGYWRKLHNEDFHDLHLSPNFNLIVNSSSVRWVGSIACIGEIRMRTMFWCKTVKDKDLLVDLDIDGEIMLKCIVKQWDAELRTGFI
jgi:hypothetical protein